MEPKLDRNEAKINLITKILSNNWDSDRILRLEGLIDKIFHKPKPSEQHNKEKKEFDKYFLDISMPAKINNTFEILKDEINKIVERNSDKQYLHIFFTEVNNNLSLIFRFSDIVNFDSFFGNLDLDVSNEEAYLLEGDKSFTLLTSQPSFSDRKIDFYKFSKNEILKFLPPKSKLTEYITYHMSDVLSFKGFNHDLKYELVCAENSFCRLALDVWIDDPDIIHHEETNSTGARIPIHEGYFDLGNLKP